MNERISAQSLEIESDKTLDELDPVAWALDRLRRTVRSRGYRSVPGSPAAQRIRVAIGDIGVDDAEAFQLCSDGRSVVLRSPHPRGLAYAITELADRFQYAEDPETVLAAGLETAVPATPVRAVLRAFCSDDLDLGWYRDRDFWAGYLDELAVHRINRFQLAFGMQYNFSHDIAVRDNYLCFAYPFLLDVPGWDVHVRGVDERQRAANLDALRWASDQAARRGIGFQLGLWSHAVRPELGASPDLRYPIDGLPDESISDYSADALELLLRACPAISGVTFRVHYEGGVPEAGHGQFWSKVMGGIRRAGRTVDVDMHAKGVDDELLSAARTTGGRVILSPKYWAEHQGLPYHQGRVRDLERPRPPDSNALSGVTQNARRFTRYGYGDFLAADRDHHVVFRVWPGTQRFLLWADPAIFAGYGRLGTIGGALGVELCEPLTFRGRKATGEGPRDLYADPDLHRPETSDWRKYAYTYRLWGRLLYDPDADPAQWRRFLTREYGAAATHVEAALAAAGRILPLVTVAEGLSASNNFYWPEVYTNLPMFPAEGPGTYDFDTPEPGTWTAVSPFDPEFFDTTDAFVADVLAGRCSGRVTAFDTSAFLEGLAADAERSVSAARGVGDERSVALRIALLDAEILVALGRMFAARIRAGISVAMFSATAQPAHLASADTELRDSRAQLARVVELATGVYVDNLAFGDRPTEQGHWRDRLEQLDGELAEITARRAELGPGDETQRIPWPPRATTTDVDVRYPDSYRCGAPINIDVSRAPIGATVRLHYRPLDQSAAWKTVGGDIDGHGAARVSIPADDTDSRYPISWYLTLYTRSGPVVRHPGLGATLSDQPYVVMTPVLPTAASRPPADSAAVGTA
jgi:hypothetical protein